MVHARVRFVALAVVLLLAASCGRSGDDNEAEPSPSPSSETSESSDSMSDDATSLAQGGFGDIEKVCQPGDAKGATDKGVTDTEIHVGTVTDKGAAAVPGLTKEMYDAAVAFTKWCNEHGGILGRQLVVDDLDAALFNYSQVITSACEQDLALVGGGAVFDDDNGQRAGCGLPNIAGYAASPKARAAELQVQPMPNPVYQYGVGQYQAANNVASDSLQSFGILTANLPTTQLIRDQSVEAVGLIGGTVLYSAEYNFAGESNWAPFIDEMRTKGVRAFEFIGEPSNMIQLQKAMSTAGWYPEVTVENTNFYDQKYLDEGGATAQNTYIRLSFTPFEMANDNKATADYLALMKQYNSGGKVALLGGQTFSSYLLFAQAATECGSDLTRACLLEKAKVSTWTAGGLHAESDPAANAPSPCILMMKVTPDGFEYDEAATKPNEGRFNCDAKNGVELQNDYGVPRS